MYLAFGAPLCLWLLDLLSCVVSGFLLEPFLNSREFGWIAIADELLFLAAQAFPSSAVVTVTDVDLDENAFKFLCHLLAPPDWKACVDQDLRAVQVFSEPRDLPFAIRQSISCLLGARLGSVPRALRLFQL